MIGPEFSPLCNGVPFLVQVTVTVPPIPSCGSAEQVMLRDCPTTATLLKGFIITAGGDGTAVENYNYIST